MPKVNANQIRVGNVVEIDNRLYTVLKAQNVIPGKGNAITTLEMRGVADGVKTEQRYRTQDSVERVFIDTRDYTYLFAAGDMHTFMDKESYEQIEVPEDVIGDQAKFLQENMEVSISLYEGKPVALEMPQTVILEVTETEPVMKGQTATSSYKPAIMSNGVRVMVPGHIGVGTRLVVSIENGTYMERAKD
jgi:elongation factor P